MKMDGCLLHSWSSVCRLYLKRKEEERGLVNVEDCTTAECRGLSDYTKMSGGSKKNLKVRRTAGRICKTKIRYSDKLLRKSVFIGFLKKKTKEFLRTRSFKQKKTVSGGRCAESTP